MKLRPTPSATPRSLRASSSCSLAVLLALGVVGAAAPGALRAQAAGTVLPPQTVPVLRAVVAGQAIVQAPAATATGQRLVIEQQSARAVLDWRSFNIGSGSEVRFNQPDATASALNRIYSADPSLIQGKLSSNGQVLLINQNGILFDRGAQVNVGALLASTLNISNDNFLNKSLTAGGNNTPAFQGGYAADPELRNGLVDTTVAVRGVILIGAGGPIDAAAPQLTAASAGSILMFAPVVENRAGLIQSPDGQVILAAGSKVYLSDANPDLQALRGMVVEVSADAGPVDLSSLVRNLGSISADRGNVTLAGLAVNQAGRVSASTAVLYNGSVYLKAGSMKPGNAGGLVADQGGTVTIGAGAMLSTPIDTTDRATMPQSQSYAAANPVDDRRSLIQISGKQITALGSVVAPGGKVDLIATSPDDAAAARIYLGPESVVSAAGNWAEVPFDANLVSFKVTSNELKDSPLQKDGVLRGQTVTVDLRKGSPLLDLSGYQDSRARSVGEKASEGGDVTLSSSGSLVQRAGAVLDVSGGGYRYAAGVAATTRLLGDDGRTYDIGSAPRDRVYISLLDSFTKNYKRWGQTRVWQGLNVNEPLREAAYSEGRKGGNLVIGARTGVVLDGQLLGGATTGQNQLAAAPVGGTLRLGVDDATNPVSLGAVGFSPRVIDTLGSAFTPTSALAAAAPLTLAADTLFPAAGTPADGTLEPRRFSRVEINAGARITVPADVQVNAGAGNTLVLRGQQVDVAGDIAAPAGTLLLQARVPADTPATAAPLAVVLRPGAELSVAGLWRNHASRDGTAVGALLPSAVGTVATQNGGSISIQAAQINLSPGSVVDVSGGGNVARNGRVGGGNAGSVNLAADPGLGSTLTSRFDADFSAFAIGNGGSLALTLPELQIGSRTPDAAAYRFGTDGFELFGFQRFSLTGARGLTVSSDTLIEPKVLSWQLSQADAVALPGGYRLADMARTQRLPADQRRPVSVTLRTTDRTQASAVLRVEDGAAIQVGAGGSITLAATAGLDVNGRLQAAGGSIALSVDGPGAQASNTLRLGPAAQLLADGAFVARPNDNGWHQGTLSDGGAVRLDARNAGLQVEAGSLISVNGRAEMIDRPGDGTAAPTVKTAIASNAGSLFIHAEDGIELKGRLSARAPNDAAAGGSFALELSKRDNTLDLPANSALARALVVTQGPAAAGVESSNPAAANTVAAAININSLSAAGFDKLRLQAEDRIELRGAPKLEFARSLRLNTAELLLASPGTTELRSAHVVLANSFGLRPAVGGALENADASQTVTTRSGSGTLAVQANTVDLYGDLTINGAALSTLAARDDLRLSGRQIGNPLVAGGAQLLGSLNSMGDVVLNAAQVYPTTLSQFTVAVQQRSAQGDIKAQPVGRLEIRASGQAPGAALSAGGAATLRADHVVQAGVLKAPLGQLALQAGSTLELSPQSLTSVTAAGLTLPFGATDAGVRWLYSATQGTANVNDLQAPPEKRITLSGTSVAQRPGATVDISGGGQLLATEFVPGSGGSRDVLQQPDTYAIIPTGGPSDVPVDRHIAALQDIGSGLLSRQADSAIYDSLNLGPGSAVPAGTYRLLPGRYALLPGAFLVQLQTGAAYSQLAPGQTVPLPSGQTIARGVRSVAGTAVQESRTVGVVVRAGSEALKESDYNLTDADFFARQATLQRRAVPALPADAGALQVAALSALRIDGNFNTAPATAAARMAQVDISGNKIAIVGRSGQAGVDASFLQVEAAALSKIQGSVLIGGTRSSTGARSSPGNGPGNSDSVRISATASEVRVANSADQPLALPELLIAATEQITVQAGSLLAGTGSGQGAAGVRTIQADAGGALLRLAGSAPAAISRGAAPDTGRGAISIEAGATLQASGAMALDATRSTRSLGNLQPSAGASVALAAGGISLGDAAAGITAPGDHSTGLVLSNAQLAAFNQLAALELKSYTRIDLLGAAQVGSSTLQQLTLDTPLLQGVGASADAVAARITAGTVVLKNSVAQAAPATGGSGALVVSGERIVSGAGDRAIAGFGSVQFTATGDIVNQGQGSLRVGGALALQSARIVGESGADQTWRAADESIPGAPRFQAVTLSATGALAGAIEPQGLGARLAVEGRSVDSGAVIVAKAGVVRLQALGSDAGSDVNLRDGGLIDVGGAARSFNGGSAVADAGRIELSAAAGQVTLAAAATLNLSAGAGGGDAGSLQLQAQTVQLNGNLQAQAASGARSGRFSLDTTAAADLPGLNRKLDTGGFFEARGLRQRQGDIVVAAGDTLRARQISLAADSGAIRIDGRLDASSAPGGGQIAVFAQGNLSLGDSAVLDASSTAAGGRVRLETRDGLLSMAEAARIDVRAGATGAVGAVNFTAPRTADNQRVAVDLRGTVLGGRVDSVVGAAAGAPGQPQAEVTVDARRLYTATDASAQAAYAADHAAFMAAVQPAQVLARLKAADGGVLSGAAVRGAVEVQSPGDFTLAESWDLSTPTWLQGGAGGTLTLRAAGTLTMLAALGLPDDNLPAGKTWNLRLAGGADLSAADALTPQRVGVLPAGSGDVVLEGAAAKVRTGSGAINIMAGRDFRLASDSAVVYTAGVEAAPNPASSGAQPNPAAGVDTPWVRDGGDVRISAGRDAVGMSNQWITDWLRRPRGTAAEARQSGWWAYRPNFRQNVASFGGGAIDITAGRDVDQLSAMSASSGRVFASAAGSAEPLTLDVQGGGNLQVQAGRELIGGEYLVSRGVGLIQAGGSVGGSVPTQLYLAGESSDVATRQATLRVVALDGVNLQSVDNPSALAQVVSRPAAGGTVQNFSARGTSTASFYSYADSARLDVTALSGDVVLGTRPAVKPGTLPGRDDNLISGSVSSGTAYPPSVAVAALGGRIVGRAAEGGGVTPAMTLFPAPGGGLRLLAAGSVEAVNAIVSDRQPATVARWNRVEDGLPGAGRNSIADPRIVERPAVDGFAFDVQALRGDIRDSEFTLPAKSRLRAGRDIVGGSYELQNLAAGDLSVVQADTGDVRPGGIGLQMGGPGRFLVQAGRNAELQTQAIATANATNPSLKTSLSARVTVVAGVSGDLDLSRLDAAYAELIEAGKAQDNQRAQAAMAAFYGNARISGGDIDSFLSSIQTTGGGDIDLLAPKGNVTVGLTTPRVGFTVGAVTSAGGAIRSQLDGNFNINQGKVVTAQGGDILIYTNRGNIDAGRGARTSVTTPAPRRVPITNGDGVVTGYRFLLPAGVSGSGIQTVSSDPDGPGPLVAPPAGDVYLFAPAGFVDAGEAGIASGANIFIAAQVVLNAANISAQGSSVGVPVVASGSLASALAASGGGPAGGNKAAEDAASAASAAAKAAAAADSLAKPAILTVEVLGFGEKNCKENQRDCFAK